MSFKHAIFHSSIVFKGDINTKFGFNLDKWLAKQLFEYSLIPDPETADCCKTNNLFIKNGFVLPRNTDLGFNITDYLRKTLNRLGTTVPSDCCKELDVVLNNSSVYYSNGEVQGLDFFKWIKSKLDSYSVGYIDPCC